MYLYDLINDTQEAKVIYQKFRIKKYIYILRSLQTHESSLHIQPESKIIFAKKKEKGKEVLPLSN